MSAQPPVVMYASTMPQEVFAFQNDISCMQLVCENYEKELFC